MTSSAFQQYLEDRYQNQVRWYRASAARSKRWHRRYQVGIVALSAVVTVTVALGLNGGSGTPWHVVSLTTSALVTVLATLQRTLRFHENWVEYRTTAEALQKEHYYHQFLCGEYGTAESPNQLFVERVEELISEQNTLWKAGAMMAGPASGLDGRARSATGPGREEQ
ncbi:MAG: DUF4231 domain-containing protein [Holophagales bacterium]|nr:DUF4231 domain-containing protein [Holophagales bacterium]MYG30891.1 DUF4231 domain-containing protein [Holophagales bacterium]MYI80370.1 DUF4231 domain-containing protein [Holophagales bacterium]